MVFAFDLVRLRSAGEAKLAWLCLVVGVVTLLSAPASARAFEAEITRTDGEVVRARVLGQSEDGEALELVGDRRIPWSKIRRVDMPGRTVRPARLPGLMQRPQRKPGATRFGFEAQYEAPRLSRVRIDGMPDEWFGRGLQAASPANERGELPAEGDLEVDGRIGWDEEGLLLLLMVADDKLVEFDDVDSLWKKDSIEVMIAADRGSGVRFQLGFGPGVTANQPKARMKIWDYRDPRPKSDIRVDWARGAFDWGYVIEARVHWSSLGRTKPELGQPAAIQWFINDSDDPDAGIDERFSARLGPSTESWRDPDKLVRLMLAKSDAVSASMDLQGISGLMEGGRVIFDDGRTLTSSVVEVTPASVGGQLNTRIDDSTYWTLSRQLVAGITVRDLESSPELAGWRDLFDEAVASRDEHDRLFLLDGGELKQLKGGLERMTKSIAFFRPEDAAELETIGRSEVVGVVFAESSTPLSAPAGGSGQQLVARLVDQSIHRGTIASIRVGERGAMLELALQDGGRLAASPGAIDELKLVHETIELLDGERISSEVLALGPDHVQLAERRLPLSQVRLIQRETVVEPPDRIAAWVHLYDGGIVPATRVDIAEDEVTLRGPLSRLTLPRRVVRLVRFAPSDRVDFGPQLPERYQEMLAERPPSADRIVVRRGEGELLTIEGLVEDYSNDGLGVNFRGASRRIATDKVDGFVLARIGDPGAAPALVVRSDVSRLPGRIISLADGVLKLELLGGQPLSLDWSSVSRVDLGARNLVFLSDLDPAAVRQQVLFVQQRPWRRDATVTGQPITLAGRRYEKGLGVQAMSELTYQLDGDYASFAALAALDEAVGVRGDCEFVVEVDGEPRWRDRLRGGSREPVMVDVTGAERLTLRVEPGENFELSDHGVWADARLIRASGDR